LIEFAEEIREFLIESNENLNALDQQIVKLERTPADELLIAGVFRTIHTIKGTSGFFGFNVLGSITHIAESILGQVREKERPLTPALVSLILETVDAVKQVLLAIESNNEEGEDFYQPLRERLNAAYQECGETTEAEPAPCDAKGSDAGTEATTDMGDSLQRSLRVPPTTASCAPEKESPRAPYEPSHLDRRSDRRMEAEASPSAERASLVDGTGPAPERVFKTRADDGAASSTIRVDVKLLDKLMNLVGELVLARNQILQGAQQSSTINATAQRLNLITSELQESVMLARMQPIGMVWNILPRVVRDLAVEMGKNIEIQMEGTSTELDKTIIEAIKDPLMHIVRNACDHGIETPDVRVAKGKSPHGTILLRAFHEGGHVNIEVSDDGAGIDPEIIKSKAVQKGLIRPEQTASMQDWEALRLIFLPGFSTVERVTSISGRGVGMDVVKTNIEKISGTVDIANRNGMGTTLKIKIPLTLAIIPGLIVSVHGNVKDAAGMSPKHRFVIPQANLVELVRLEGEKGLRQIEQLHGAEVYRRRGKLLPVAYLSDVLGISSGRANNGRRKEDADQDAVINIVVVQADDTVFGLVVDEVNDTQEIVVKALGRQLKALTCYLGATIMGDGTIALILDVTGLAHLANVMTLQQESAKSEIPPADATRDVSQTLLLFRVGKFFRLALPLSLVARLEEVPSSSTEYAGGSLVLHYRDTIMPLISLNALLDAGAPDIPENNPRLQVIVFQERGGYVGMIVDEILDIVQETVDIKSTATTFGLLGSGVVNGRVTDFVDVDALLNKLSGEFEELA
jgi:two-component system chemotaxis sensor kinase CheA